jgi:hypothetical protein
MADYKLPTSPEPQRQYLTKVLNELSDEISRLRSKVVSTESNALSSSFSITGLGTKEQFLRGDGLWARTLIAGTAASTAVGALSEGFRVDNDAGACHIDVVGQGTVDFRLFRNSTGDFWSLLYNPTSSLFRVQYNASTDFMTCDSSTGITHFDVPVELRGGTTIGNAAGDALTINSNTATISNGINFTGGNVGIGVAPSAWSGVTALQVLGASIYADSVSAGYGANYYYDGTNFRYRVNGASSILISVSGGFEVYTTPSGTAGNVATMTRRFGLTEDGRFFGSSLHNNAGAVTGTTNQYIASGTYTPTITDISNVALSDSYLAKWTRVGNVVTVAGHVDTGPTASGAFSFRMSLPIASNLANYNELSGTTCDPGVSGRIYADAANNEALFDLTAPTGTRGWTYVFKYEIK